MAATKTHPIKSTLKETLDYIKNPDKTDDRLLVVSFICSYEAADIGLEMLLVQVYQEGDSLSHRLTQSFAPGEATPERAYGIGKQFAEEVLQGKYPYVLTIHTDKNHVHNHITFCAADMVNQRKYISNKQSYAYIRRTSDRLYKENGLSVVKSSQSKGRGYAERNAQRKGTSQRAKLKAATDAAIPQIKDLDDFLRPAQAQDYEIKPGKFISFRVPGQERFAHYKTLEEAYTEEVIRECIKDCVIIRAPKEHKGISLRIDLENNIKAQQSAGYERWAKLHSLRQAAKILNFLTERGIDTYPDLENKVARTTAASDGVATIFETMEHRLVDMAVLIKNIFTYKQLRPAAMEYRNATDKAKFRREYESTLILYEATIEALKGQSMKELPDLYALRAEYKQLAEEKERLCEKYGEAKKQMQEYGIIKQNVDGILHMTPGKEWTQEL